MSIKIIPFKNKINSTTNMICAYFHAESHNNYITNEKSRKNFMKKFLKDNKIILILCSMVVIPVAIICLVVFLESMEFSTHATFP